MHVYSFKSMVCSCHRWYPCYDCSLPLFKQDQEQPLIFQAATSAVDPMTNEQCYAAVTRKEAEMPPRFKVFHGYPKPDMREIYCRTRE